MLKNKKVYLIYVIVCIVSKQAMKVSDDAKVHPVYLVVCTDEFYCKLSEGR